MASPQGTPFSELDAHQRELQQLDSQIHDLESQLESARSRRDFISRQILLLTPSPTIRRIPNEVLAIIFGHDHDDQCIRNYTLMYVCRLWHELVVNTPTLWNKVELKLHRFNNLPKVWRYTEMTLSRSGTVPLDIVLDTSALIPHGEYVIKISLLYLPSTRIIDGLKELRKRFQSLGERSAGVEYVLFVSLAILRGHNDKFMSRWRSFHFELGSRFDPAVSIRIWNSLSGTIRHLLHLEFNGPLHKDYHYHPYPDGVLVGLNGLRSLRSFSTNLQVAFDRLSLPISQLEQLTLYVPASDYFVEFASSSFQVLRVLHLGFDNESNYRSLTPDIVVNLPTLEVLFLSGSKPDILRRFITPKLTHLGIHTRRSRITSWITEIPNTVTDVLLGAGVSIASPTIDVAPISGPLQTRGVLHLHIPHADELVSSERDMMDTQVVYGTRVVEFISGSDDWAYPIPRDFLE